MTPVKQLTDAIEKIKAKFTTTFSNIGDYASQIATGNFMKFPIYLSKWGN